MNKFKKRRDISTMVNMVGKLKNPADETMANLKSIEDMLASDESGYVIPPISSNISAFEEDQLKDSKKKDKSLSLEEDQKKILEEAIESGDKKAIKKSGARGRYKRAAMQDLKAKQKQDIDKASESLKFMGEVNRLNPEGSSMASKIFRKRKTRKAEGADAKRKAEEEAKKKKYRMTAFDEPPPNYYGELDPPLPEPTL